MHPDRSEPRTEPRLADAAEADADAETEKTPPAEIHLTNKWDIQSEGSAWLESQLQRKRARDRRAQQKARDKRTSLVQGLENQIATLNDELRELRHYCEALYQENQVLHSQRDNVRHAVGLWERPVMPASEPGPTEHANHHLPHLHDTRVASSRSPDASRVGCHRLLGDLPPGVVLENCNISQHGTSWDIPNNQDKPPTHGSIVLSQTRSISGETHVDQDNPGVANASESETGPWSMPPKHNANDALDTEQIVRYLAHPELVHASSDIPTPLEILYGSPTNFLADIIHKGMLRWPSGEPERLAAGLLHYQFIKWTMNPTKTAFSRLCDFQKPVYEQISQTHHYFIDFIAWPKLRANMIKYKHLYNASDAMSLLTCCQKMRWPWRRPFLQPNTQGILSICPDFYNTFTKIEGWGLTDEYIRFLNQHPELLEGIDVESMRFQFL